MGNPVLRKMKVYKVKCHMFKPLYVCEEKNRAGRMIAQCTGHTRMYAITNAIRFIMRNE